MLGLATFPYRLRRLLSRKMRTQFVNTYRVWDGMRMGLALKDCAPKSALLNFAKLAPWGEGGEVAPPVEIWAGKNEAKDIIALADRACDHVFDLLGSGPVHLGEQIDWQADFKTGFRWPERTHHLRMPWDRVPAGTDIKNPWELSRCQHFAAFGFADWISGDPKYYREFKNQISQWIASNPYEFGVNWMCSMDIAIRAVNWLNAVMMFRHRIKNDDDNDFFELLIESLWMHGRHIMRNLEWRGPQSTNLSNHFLADLVGLLAIGALFFERMEGERYWSFASKWLESEIFHQVSDDGTLYETSTSYHRLSFEIFLWSSNLADCCGRSFSEKYNDRLIRMADFVRAYTSPTGVAAQFGDNDSGRLLRVGIDDLGNHLYLTDGECGFGGRANRFLFCGKGSAPPTDDRIEGGFPNGGYWFMRNDRAWIGVRAGILSHGGAHAHCDQISFVLAVDGDDFIIDPGTGVYSSDVKVRNQYRSASAHNACRINEWEPNSFRDGKFGLFQMSDDTKTEVLDFHGAEGGSLFVGRHHGYGRFRRGMIYERSLVLHPGFLEIRDMFECLESGDWLNWSFRFAPGVELSALEEGVVADSGKHRMRIITDPGMEWEISDCRYSPSYGVEIPAKEIVIRALHSKSAKNFYRIIIDWMSV